MELLRGPNKDNINALIFYEYFQTENEFCIVQELCDGNIQHLLEKKKTFKVKEIFQFLKQLNNTFHILLDKNLSHKNLRLDNILYRKTDNGDDYIYKLTGLEFNRKVNDLFKRGGVMLNEKYKAPEILISEFSSKNLSSKEMNLNELQFENKLLSREVTESGIMKEVNEVQCENANGPIKVTE